MLLRTYMDDILRMDNNLTETVNAYGGGYHAWDVSKSQFVSFQKVS